MPPRENAVEASVTLQGHITSRPATAAEMARRRAGLTVAQAAKRAGLAPKTYRAYELQGGVPMVAAERMAWAIGCRIDLFCCRTGSGRRRGA